MINIIVAVGNYVCGKGHPIGKQGGMPWHNKNDLKWFKDMTTGNVVIMGRKTFEAIGHPLKNRINIVVTSRNDLRAENSNIRVCNSLESAINFASTFEKEIFIIGGASIYKQAMDADIVDRIYIDILKEDAPDADAFFPDIFADNEWVENGSPIEIEKSKAYAVSYIKLRGKDNHVDEQYQNLVNDIIKNGVEKDTRAGRTRSIFGVQMRFNLKEGLPMLTTKKMFAKGVIHELLWFLKGDTNIKYLVENGVHIWDDDAYRYFIQTICKKPGAGDAMDKEEFLKHVLIGDAWHFFADKSYRFGDLGPVYGHQWRDWGGVDQVKEVIEKLRNNPDDRRIMISAWNVDEIKDMALSPCHYSCQFYAKKMTIDERLAWAREHNINTEIGENIELLDEWGVPSRKLSCMWNQRSVDTLLGLPFNILSYAILTHIIAHIVNMDVDELIFNGGDVHVYENQIEEYERSQKGNSPHMYALPKISIGNNVTTIEDVNYGSIKIEGYKSYPKVSYPLSVGL